MLAAFIRIPQISPMTQITRLESHDLSEEESPLSNGEFVSCLNYVLNLYL